MGICRCGWVRRAAGITAHLAELQSHCCFCTWGALQTQAVKAVCPTRPPCPPTEGTLVEQQVRLQRAQQTERRYLAAAFTRVGDLERRRAAGQAQVLAAFVRIYRAELVPIQEIAGEPWHCFKVSVL